MKTDAPVQAVAHIRVAASPPDGRQSYVGRYEPPTDGFAARCEARLCLAVEILLEVGAMPPVRRLAQHCRAKPEPRA